ncbi:hypothetical protein ACB098_05G205100 [Castanea mollissima]
MHTEIRDFTVTVTKKEVVVAAQFPNQEHWLPLSNLDICLVPPLDFSLYFCYTKPTCGDNWTFGSKVEVLKKALAKALVPYYALAGEIVPNSVGEPEILCNNRGVDFIEGFADIELQNLNLYRADETIGCKLVPKKKNGMLAVQATGFKCGGLMVTCTFGHKIMDGYSASMFLISWAEIAQSKPLSSLPTFCRSLLNPRIPGSFDSSLENLCIPITSFHPNPIKEPNLGGNNFVSRTYIVKANIINQIQSLASTNECKRTKVECFSALLWKIIAKSGTADKNISKLGILVDGRTRIGRGDEEKTKILASYFGNLWSIPYGSKTVDDLIDKPLSWVANEVHGIEESGMMSEHFLGLLDWAAAHRSAPSLPKIYACGSREGPALVVSSLLRLPFSNVQFGWGRPTCVSAYFPWGGDAGYVLLVQSPSGNGDWVVYMYILKEELELIEREAGHMLRPLTLRYFNEFEQEPLVRSKM